jgi:hypothetical protein
LSLSEPRAHCYQILVIYTVRKQQFDIPSGGDGRRFPGRSARLGAAVRGRCPKAKGQPRARKRASTCQMARQGGSGNGFGDSKRRTPKYTTYGVGLRRRYTRYSAFPQVPGVRGFRSRRLCPSVGFGTRLRMALRESRAEFELRVERWMLRMLRMLRVLRVEC